MHNAYQEIGNVIWDQFLDLGAEMNTTDAEYQLLRAVSLFSVVPGLSKEGRTVVRKAQAFYRNALIEFVKQSNPIWTERQVTERVAALICLVPNMEVSSVYRNIVYGLIFII